MTGKVLVVDDVPQNVKLLEAKLASEYYTVFPTYSGTEAIKKAKEVSPDVILLDVMMPDMDGFETCKILKETPETAYIPVVMVTALSDTKDRVQGLAAGASDFITKPIDEVHLFARVKSLIRLKTMLDELRMRDKTGSELGLTENSPRVSEEKVKGKIIVIDDDIVQSKKIQDVLSSEGHTVEISGYEEVANKVANSDCDLVIVNTSLDDVDGLRLAMEIRSQAKHRQTPIMILVEEDEKHILVKGLEIGIDDYLLTPMDTNELIARVSTQLKSKKYQDALRANYQESLSAAVVDSLTKLYNRRYLDAHLHNMVLEAIDKKKDLSLMTIDIDHFKLVNDTPGWGHDIGDQVLKQVAERILGSVRNTDLATRPGGEEFVVVMPNTSLEITKMVGERTRGAMADMPFKITAEPGEIECTVSIGVASLKDENDSAQDILKRSDEALFKAKNGGRNMVVIAEQ